MTRRVPMPLILVAVAVAVAVAVPVMRPRAPSERLPVREHVVENAATADVPSTRTRPTAPPTQPQSGYPPPVLHQEVAGLPVGSTPQIDRAVVIRDNPGAHVRHLVPVVLANGTADLALVASDAGTSRVAWRARADADWSAQSIVVQVADFDGLRSTPSGMGPPAPNARFIAAFDLGTRTRLLVLDVEPRGQPPSVDVPVVVDAALDLEGAPWVASHGSLSVVVQDWSGDDAADVMLVEAGAQSCIEGDCTPVDASIRLFAGAVPAIPRVLSDRPASVPLIEAQLAAVVTAPVRAMDIDDDGVIDLVEPAVGGWRARRWSGGAFGPPADLPGEFSPIAVVEAQPVDMTALPSLPADLFWLRDGIIWHWLSSGGSPQALSGANAARSARRDPTGPVGPPESFQVSTDGATVVYPLRFERKDGDGFTRDEIEFVIVDTGRGTETMRTRVAGFLGGFVLAPDAEWIAYLAFGVADDGQPTSRVWRLDLRAGAAPIALASCAGDCEGIAIDPAGATVAFGDDQGLWLVGASARATAHLLAANIPEERAYRPSSFSPDGRRILADVSLFEGGTKTAIDVASAYERGLGVFEYVCCRADLAWSRSGQALLRATVGTLHRDPVGNAGLSEALLPSVGGPWDEHGASTRAMVSPVDLGDGHVAVAVRALDDNRDSRSGIYVVDRVSRAWRRVIVLPPIDASDEDAVNDVAQAAGHVVWGVGGRAFAFQDRMHAVVGQLDPPVAWDVPAWLAGIPGATAGVSDAGAQGLVWRARIQ
jgi:hypothetical protein